MPGHDVIKLFLANGGGHGGKTIAPPSKGRGFEQGSLTEEEGSVQLTSSY